MDFYLFYIHEGFWSEYVLKQGKTCWWFTFRCHCERKFSIHSDKKMLNHQEKVLVTGLQRQVLIEWLLGLQNIKQHTVHASITRFMPGDSLGKRKKSLLTKLAPVCFKNICQSVDFFWLTVRTQKISYGGLYSRANGWHGCMDLYV